MRAAEQKRSTLFDNLDRENLNDSREQNPAKGSHLLLRENDSEYEEIENN